MPVEAFVARFDGFMDVVIQEFGRGKRDFDPVTADDIKRVLPGCRIGNRGARCNDCRIVARHIGHQIGHHACGRAGGGKPAALYRRQVFAHTVHFGNRRAAMKQGFADGLFVFECQARTGQGQQGRPAAGNHADHQIIGTSGFDDIKNTLGSLLPGGIGDRVGGFDNFDFFARDGMTIAGDDQAGHIAIPCLLEGTRHIGRCLARPDDDGFALGLCRQVARDLDRRIGGLKGGIHQLQKFFARGCHVWFP